MSLKVLEDKKLLSVDKDLLKISLGIEADDDRWDEYIEHIIHKATSYVETYTQRTIMTKTLEYTHQNNTIYLPKPRISQILKVSSNGQELKEGEYQKYHSVDTMVIVLGKEYANNENTVTYIAGYGDQPDDVPATLRNIIFDCARILFEQGQHADPESMNKFTKYVKDTVADSDINDRSYFGLSLSRSN